MELADCGAACLAMVLGYYRRHLRLGVLREATGTTGRDGVNALSILEAARAQGLRARGVKVEDPKDLRFLQAPSILHFISATRNMDHFVVFERFRRFRRKKVEIVDPALGRRRLSLHQFGKLFTGVALELEPTEDLMPLRDDTKRVRRYLKHIVGHPVLPRILVTTLLVQALALALPFLTQMLIDRVIPRGDSDTLKVVGIGLAAVVGFNLLTLLTRAHLLLHWRTHLDVQMTLSFVEHLVRLPYAFFQKRSAGDLMMRLNSNTTIREILTSSVLSGFFDGLMATLYLVLLFLMSKPMGAMVLALGSLQGFLFVLTRQRYMDLMTEELHAQSLSQGYQVEMLTGIETLKAGGAEHRATEHWSHLFVDVLNISLARGRLSANVNSLLATLSMASPLLILWFGAWQALEQRITLGTLFAINALAAGFLVPFSALVQTALQWTLLRSYFERIDDVLETAPEQDAQQVSRAHKLQGSVALADVSFRYGTMAPLVVRDVSLQIEPGRHIAIVGRSGSGKSTLARLLIGLYTPTEGQVLYDGVDLTGLDYHSVRSQVGLVPQNPYLFGTTILANIALTDPTLSLDAVEEAARLAHIDEDVAMMPMGYDTLLADGGASLSGGQRQRIALARALAQKPTILVLDEATSDLDTVTESAIQRELDSLSCTRIVIAHRLSTIVRADRILVMEAGRIVEQGRHEELLALGGKYAELVSAQVNRNSSDT